MTQVSPLNSKVINACQNCDNKLLNSELFLGHIPPVNQMEDVESCLDAEIRFPLELKSCNRCHLVQIGYDVDQRILFPESYPYLSGSTQILRENFRDLCEESQATLNLNKTDLILDIGANDGTLLTPFFEAGFNVIGVEPSQAADIARKNNIPMVKDYFNQTTATAIAQDKGKCQLVTAANVFAHITDVHGVINAIKTLLKEDGGVFVSENHYLISLVETLQYDTIYHEHLRYYSLTSLIPLFAQHDLEVFKVKPISTHGGSIRVYTARKGQYPIDSSVVNQLALEEERGVSNGKLLKTFANDVAKTKIDLLKLLAELKQQGASIYGIGAPSRSSTLVNYVGLDEDLIDCIVEISTSNKLNKYVPGTRIPVLDEQLLFDKQPEYAIFFSWHIMDELANKLREKGFTGKFITPLPSPRILSI